MTVPSVLLATPRWTRDGGVATHVMASARALAEHGVDVSVAAARIDHTTPVTGVNIFHTPELFARGIPPGRRLEEALSAHPTVIHLHQVDDPELVNSLRRSAPVLLSAHGYTACTSGVHYFRPGQECTRAHGLGCVPNLGLRGCAHTSNPRRLPAAYRSASRGLEALREADLAISYSSAVDRHLSVNEVTQRTVIPYFPTMAPAVGSGHAGRRRVVFAGRVVAPKGVDVLIRAACTVEAEFVICGDGWRLEEMRRLAHELGVQEGVRFEGLARRRRARAGTGRGLGGGSALGSGPSRLDSWASRHSRRDDRSSPAPPAVSATWLDHGVSGLAVEARRRRCARGGAQRDARGPCATADDGRGGQADGASAIFCRASRRGRARCLPACALAMVIEE